MNIGVKIAESSIGSSAALHLACAVPKADWGVSLSHLYLAEDIVKTPIALCESVSLPQAQALRGSLAELPRLAASLGGGPALILIGAVFAQAQQRSVDASGIVACDATAPAPHARATARSAR